MSMVGHGCRARRRTENAGGAKGQIVLIGIPDMLHCVRVLVPLRSLLLYSHHMPSQNKMRLPPHSCMLKILPATCLAKQLSKALFAQCPLVMSSNLCCRLWMMVWLWSKMAFKKKVLSNPLIFKKKKKKGRRDVKLKNSQRCHSTGLINHTVFLLPY